MLNLSGLSSLTLQTILKAIPAGVIVVEKQEENLKITYINERAIQLWGFDLRAFQAKKQAPPVKLLNLNGEPCTFDKLPAKKAILTGKEEKEDIIIEHLDGSRTFVSICATPVRDKTGNVIAAVGIFQDTTAHRKVEEDLQRAEKDWERTFDSIPDFIAILDTDYKIVRANKAMAKQLGLSPEEAKGLICYEHVHGT